jgi:hypothetical protein
VHPLTVHKLHGGPGGVYSQKERREFLKPGSLLGGEKKASPGVFGNLRRGFDSLRSSLGERGWGAAPEVFAIQSPLRGGGRSEQKEGNPQGEENHLAKSSWRWTIYKKCEEGKDDFFHGFPHIEIP